ncbi:hypothetical protein GCM10027535_16200 [Mycolicibacterium hippocampi]|uniref:Uncharacterized protein n=1 Tax=Mycolicibacterium hippocampi TaxID=659824 RepID=A0A7I9ZG60_9MYCO|nr:hypothetical protein MHIP_01700 [Mycolicibacterium hippocampi]
MQFLVAGFDEVEQVGGDGGEAFAQPVGVAAAGEEVGVGGHGCSPFVYGLGAPVSAGVAGDRRGGARNLEEAVTSGAGFSARASPARSALASWRWAEKVTRPAQFGAGVGCA